LPKTKNTTLTALASWSRVCVSALYLLS